MDYLLYDNYLAGNAEFINVIKMGEDKFMVTRASLSEGYAASDAPTEVTKAGVKDILETYVKPDADMEDEGESNDLQVNGEDADILELKKFAEDIMVGPSMDVDIS